MNTNYTHSLYPDLNYNPNNMPVPSAPLEDDVAKNLYLNGYNLGHYAGYWQGHNEGYWQGHNEAESIVAKPIMQYVVRFIEKEQKSWFWTKPWRIITRMFDRPFFQFHIEQLKSHTSEQISPELKAFFDRCKNYLVEKDEEAHGYQRLAVGAAALAALKHFARQSHSVPLLAFSKIGTCVLALSVFYRLSKTWHQRTSFRQQEAAISDEGREMARKWISVN